MHEKKCPITSLLSKQWTMKMNVPCCELRMTKRYLNSIVLMNNPRIQVHPKMRNWAAILKIISLGEKTKRWESEGGCACVWMLLWLQRIMRASTVNPSDSWHADTVHTRTGTVGASTHLVSFDWETSLFMLARVGRKVQSITQNEMQLSCFNCTQRVRVYSNVTHFINESVFTWPKSES